MGGRDDDQGRNWDGKKWGGRPGNVERIFFVCADTDRSGHFQRVALVFRDEEHSEKTADAPGDRGCEQVDGIRQRHQPTEPSRLIEISFCASTANSMGSCWITSLTKPLTINATASSSLSPRCWQ